MLVRRVAIENVRSFLDRAELQVDGAITIVIGPNGGGKANLLDTRGSIDHADTRDAACSILEGAKEAFLRRAKMYAVALR